MSRTFTFTVLAVLVAASAPLARSQTFYFIDGRKASFPEAHIQGANIIVPLKLSTNEGGTGEMSLPITNLTRIDWPVPPEVAAADADLKAGQPEEALKKIEAVLGTQEPFRAVAGSWWSQGAIIRAEALARLGKDADAEVLIDRMRTAKTSPVLIVRGELAVVDSLLRAGKRPQARSRLDLLQSKITDQSNSARIALVKGRLFLDDGHPEDALLSYLRVPVLYSTEEDQLPAAFLGVYRSYRAMGDEARAAATRQTLATRFPKSPEAAEAQR